METRSGNEFGLEWGRSLLELHMNINFKLGSKDTIQQDLEVRTGMNGYILHSTPKQ